MSDPSTCDSNSNLQEAPNLVLGYHGYTIKKNWITREKILEIKSELTVKPRVPPEYSNVQPDYFRVYQESKSKLYLPKIYGIEHFGLPEKIKFPPSTDISLTFHGQLRPEQVAPAEAWLRAAHDPNKRGGILALPCAFGKTSIAIWLLCQIGKKTLIIVHKDFLLTQWKERIAQFTPDAKVGTIKAQIIDVEGKDIVMASLQSLAMKTYDESIFHGFSFVVCDECFDYHQKIVTNQGPVKIGVLYELWALGEKLPLILSYNQKNGEFALNRMTYGWIKWSRNLLKIHFDNGVVLSCTRNHKILTSRGMVPAGYLNFTDKVWGVSQSTFAEVDVISIQECNHNSNVYDIEVEHDHTFVACDTVFYEGIIASNCHHLGAETFSQALKKVNFSYSLGLSATVTRKDGLTKVFKWYLGDVVYSIKRNSGTVQVVIKNYYVSDPNYSKVIYGYGGQRNIPRMINNICDYHPRTQFIADIIDELLIEEPDRRVLLLSDRRAHLEAFKKLLDLKGIDCGFYMGGLGQAVLKRNESRNIILGTFAISSEGLDIAGLNTLVLASPKSDVVQSCGRILRDTINKRTYTPLIIDIADNFSLFANQAKKRLKYYQKEKYEIQDERIIPPKHNEIKLDKYCIIEDNTPM